MSHYIIILCFEK